MRNKLLPLLLVGLLALAACAEESASDPTSGSDGAGGTGSTTNGESPSPGDTAAAKGVTEDTIKIGILAPGENPRTGNLHEAYEAEVDRWRQEGLLPVHGRDVELVHYDYDLLEERAGPPQRAACVNLAEEEEVFAVMVWTSGTPEAAECLTTEFETPVIASVASFDQDHLERGWPYFFHTELVTDRVLRNWPHWADEFGHLEDRTIGLYYTDNPAVKAQIDENFRPALDQLGYSIAEEQAAGEGQGSTSIAVQRFQAAGVDTIFLMWQGTRNIGQGAFSQAAEEQDYRPRYLLSDFESSAGTSDTAPQSYGWVPEQFDNAYAMTYWRRGETGSAEQEPVPPVGEECMENYFEYSGRRYDKSDPSESGTYDAHQPTCDQGKAMIAALQEAGPQLTEMSLVRGLETAVNGQPSGALGDLSFSSEHHDGASQVKTNQGDAECFCWVNVEGFRDLWVD